MDFVNRNALRLLFSRFRPVFFFGCPLFVVDIDSFGFASSEVTSFGIFISTIPLLFLNFKCQCGETSRQGEKSGEAALRFLLSSSCTSSPSITTNIRSKDVYRNSPLTSCE